MVEVSSRGWVLFIAMSIIWGIPYLMIKIAVEGVSVPVLVFARTAIGAAVLLPLALSSGIPTIIRKYWKPLLGFAFFEIIAAWFLLSDAERHLTSSMTGLLIAASPIIAAVLDRFTGGEQRLGFKRILGLGVGLSGVAVLAGSAPHRRERLADRRGAVGGHVLRHRAADRRPPSRRRARAPDDRHLPGFRRPGLRRARRGDLADRDAIDPSAAGRWPGWR